MPYTLAKFVLWGLLMALAGGIVGWMLRSLKARVDVARSRPAVGNDAEAARLRGRLANLEPVVAERDRLRMELADVRGSSAGALGFSSTIDAANARGIDAANAPTIDATIGTTSDTGFEVAAPPDVAPVLDLAAAAKVLRRKIELDDLTVVEGIGPKIAELCRGIGVHTWSDLAAADVALLQSMLDAAGSRFQMHRPATWPQQAELLAAGRWEDFRALTASFGS